MPMWCPTGRFQKHLVTLRRVSPGLFILSMSKTSSALLKEGVGVFPCEGTG